MTGPKSLKSRFPYQFSGENFGISTPRGWLSLFERLCLDIHLLLGENKREFHWTQVKTKFGSGRAYWAMNKADGPLYVDVLGRDGVVSFQSEESGDQPDPDTAELMKAIDVLVNAAMDRTSETCAVCGAPGKIDSSDGYLMVLCPDHTAQREKDPGSMDTPWFDHGEWS